MTGARDPEEARARNTEQLGGRSRRSTQNIRKYRTEETNKPFLFCSHSSPSVCLLSSLVLLYFIFFYSLFHLVILFFLIHFFSLFLLFLSFPFSSFLFLFSPFSSYYISISFIFCFPSLFHLLFLLFFSSPSSSLSCASCCFSSLLILYSIFFHFLFYLVISFFFFLISFFHSIFLLFLLLELLYPILPLSSSIASSCFLSFHYIPHFPLLFLPYVFSFPSISPFPLRSLHHVFFPFSSYFIIPSILYLCCPSISFALSLVSLSTLFSLPSSLIIHEVERLTQHYVKAKKSNAHTTE